MASHRPLTLKQAQDLLRHNEEQIKALHSKNDHLRSIISAHHVPLAGHGESHKHSLASASSDLSEAPSAPHPAHAHVHAHAGAGGGAGSAAAHDAAHELGDKARFLIRIENACHRFHHHFDTAHWEDQSLGELSVSANKLEQIADIHELEQIRRDAFPGTEPYYTHAPSPADHADDVAVLHAKATALSSLQQLVAHPTLLRLQPQAAKYTVTNTSEELVDAATKARLLKEIRTHLKHVTLLGAEKTMDLTTPLESIRGLWSTTHADQQLMKTFPKCAMCHFRHAPEAVLKKHPHLNLRPTGTTHSGGRQCCVSCAPYYD